MDEILKKLLQSELLSEDVKVELKSQWKESVSALKESFREEALLEVRAELSGQWVTERDALIESLEKFTGEKLDSEIKELKEDIERFRDLEVEYAGKKAELAEKLTEEKQALAAQLAEEIESLTDHIDAFFEVRLAEELEELKEDIQIVRENEFGRKMFESFVSEFNKSFVDEASVQRKLAISEDKLKDAKKHAAKLEESVQALERDKKMDEVLSPLSGSKREQMAFILSNIETKKLDEAYKMFVGRVLKEDVAPSKTALTENKKEVKTTLITGDVLPKVNAAQKLEESTKSPEILRAMSLAGIKQSV